MNSRISRALCAAGALVATIASGNALAANAFFGEEITENTTGFANTVFLGGPDGSSAGGNTGVRFVGIGREQVTFFFPSIRIIDGPGGDLNVYEVDFGGNEFNSVDILVSQDGLTYLNIDSPRLAIVPVDNDPGHTNDSFAQSFDLAGTGLAFVQYVRIDGSANGAAGGTTGFDFDAIGAVNFESTAVPLPAAVWLFGAACAGLGLRRRRSNAS